ncbi:trypsin-1-like [Oppia nitens]|uniref:trypsin-1-like n=1 Tax=Oppia nitens TaxID=1686743 RepID=UPI0023DCC687|nr:trypsin-1-like [Oppia nitens]
MGYTEYDYIKMITMDKPVSPNPLTQDPSSPELMFCGYLSSECQSNRITNRVVNGNLAHDCSWPWMAALLMGDMNFQYCGGVLIDKLHVLTAAHCVDPNTQVKILLGTLDLHKRHSDAREYMSSKITVHNKFDWSTMENDIALIELQESVRFTPRTWPICLPKQNTDYTGDKASVAGWGITSENGDPIDQLQEVNVPVWDIHECRRAYNDSYISDSMLCAGHEEGGKDSCQGDSGGPIIWRNNCCEPYRLIGIVSWGEGCARPNKPGIYTRVDSFIDWIKENII